MSNKWMLSLSQDSFWIGISMASAALILFYLYFLRKNKFSGNPSDIPREEPPASLSPAVMRYIWRPGFDLRCLLAGILSAAMKDVYRIQWRNESFSIYLNKQARFQRLSSDEKAALSFSQKNYLERLGVGKKRNQFIRRAGGRMADHIRERYSDLLLRKHVLLLIGLSFSLLGCMILAAIFSPVPLPYLLGYFLFIIPLTGGMLYGIYYALRLKLWAALAMGATFSFVGLMMIYHVESAFPFYLFPFLFPLILINILYYVLLPQRKPAGEKLHIEIEEFRNFLSDRLDEDMSLEQSEYYLIPYLVALEIPFQNQEYFEAIFSENPQQMGRLPGSPVG